MYPRFQMNNTTRLVANFELYVRSSYWNGEAFWFEWGAKAESNNDKLWSGGYAFALGRKLDYYYSDNREFQLWFNHQIIKIVPLSDFGYDKWISVVLDWNNENHGAVTVWIDGVLVFEVVDQPRILESTSFVGFGAWTGNQYKNGVSIKNIKIYGNGAELAEF